MTQNKLITFEELPAYVCQLGEKIEQLISIIQSPAEASPQKEIGGIEVAREVTRLSRARIYALVAERNIPHFKRGNRLTFRRSDLVNWLEQGRRGQKGGPA